MIDPQLNLPATDPDAFAPGTVSIVGAGPGDPELLTLRACRRITAADVVLHDHLVSPGVLALAACARRIDVGKVGGGPATCQALIHRLLVREATAGNRVVRLKGGDPFVFGRGAEEALFLAGAGVVFEIVPGISSSVSAGAAACIPTTHRGVSTHFSVVTATAAGDSKALEHPWRALVTAGGTVVFLMGLRRLPRIVEVALDAGASPDRRIAVVSRATCEGERVVDGTLATIVDRVRAADVATPATIILGDVVAVGAHLRALSATSGTDASGCPAVAV